MTKNLMKHLHTSIWSPNHHPAPAPLAGFEGSKFKQLKFRAMKTDINGYSTCKAGSEHYETFKHPRTGKTMVQYDYRHPKRRLTLGRVGKISAPL